MRIHSLSITRTSENVEKISAGLDETEIYFEVTGAPDRLRESYDPFVLAAFPYAMVKGGEMEVDGDAPVSRPLVENLHRAIEMYLQWWPYLADLRICPTRVEDHPPKGSGHVGCFFSGGVDSLYSYERNAAEITHLILCLGLDMGFDEMERWNRTVEFVSDVADARGKGLVLVKTNAKAPLRMPGRADGHGARLSSTAMAAGFGTLIIPASNSLDQLAPWGSHPMLDPLFSNGVTEVIHDSPIRRSRRASGLQCQVVVQLRRVRKMPSDQVRDDPSGCRKPESESHPRPETTPAVEAPLGECLPVLDGQSSFCREDGPTRLRS